MTPRLLPPLLLLVPLVGCSLLGGGAGRPASSPHYVLESAWHAPNGAWFYPRQSFSYDETGLASVYRPEHSPLTTDGEVYDPEAMTAASQTLQLPAIARVTNLENGRQAVVRINDRGPASPARLIALTPRAAGLLGIPPHGTAQVRVQVESGPSEALAQAFQAPGTQLAITAAPVAAVRQAPLAPPPGVAAAPESGAAPATRPKPAASLFDAPLPPVHLPATATQGAPAPGRLTIRADRFETRAYAEQQRRALAAIGARVVPAGTGRNRSYQVLAGPFPNVAAADAALATAIAARAGDARIVVQ